jgi:uncharacterized protein (UPF0276 family)
MTPSVGFFFPPDPTTLERCAPVIAAVDHLAVSPEHLVAPVTTETLRTNGYARRLRALVDRHGCALVAHGLSLSPCTSSPLDDPRLDRWLRHAAALTREFRFTWYTDHFGWSAPAGLNATAPLPVPHTRSVRDATRRRLDRLADAVEVPVGLENSAWPVALAPIDDEARFLADATGPHHVLLDVHNLWTHEQNFGTDVDGWFEDAPCERVIEIHVSGGSWSPEGSPRRRMDSHDTAVPEPVWALLDRALAACPNVRGVTLERLDGTVQPADVDGLLAEIERVRAAVARRSSTPAPERAPQAADWPDDDPAEVVFADAWTSNDPLVVLRRLADDPSRSPTARAAAARAVADPGGVTLMHHMVAGQRYVRLVRGSPRANGWSAADPAGFARAFADYNAAVPPTAFLPGDEALLFDRDA